MDSKAKVFLKISLNFCLLYLIGTISAEAIAQDTASGAHILTDSVRIDLDLTIAKSLESWDNLSVFCDKVHDQSGILILYPRTRVSAYSSAGSKRTLDILLLGVSGVVEATIEEMTGDGWYARPVAAMGVVVLPGGFCKTNHIAPGHRFDMDHRDSFFKTREEMHPDDIVIVTKKLEENLTGEPGNPKWKEQLALFYLGIGHHHRSIELLDQLLTHQINSQWMDMKGKALLYQQKPSEAEMAFRDAIKNNPDDYEPYAHLSALLYGNARVEEAIRLLSGYIMEKENNSSARIDLARVFLSIYRAKEAIQVLDLESDGQKDDPLLIRIYGDALVQLGDFDRAAEAYLTYLQACPFNPDAKDLKVFVTVHKHRKRLVTDENK